MSLWVSVCDSASLVILRCALLSARSVSCFCVPRGRLSEIDRAEWRMLQASVLDVVVLVSRFSCLTSRQYLHHFKFVLFCFSIFSHSGSLWSVFQTRTREGTVSSFPLLPLQAMYHLGATSLSVCMFLFVPTCLSLSRLKWCGEKRSKIRSPRLVVVMFWWCGGGWSEKISRVLHCIR